MAQRLGLDVEVLDAEWGEGAPIERYQEALAADKAHTGSRQCCSPTTRRPPASPATSPGIRRALNDDPAPGTAHGRWRELHRAVSTSEWMSGVWTWPLPGRRRASCCRPAWASSAPARRRCGLYEQAKLPRVFFDFGDMRKANATGYFPYTPSLPMLYGLRESLAMLLEEGLENVLARHHRLAEGTRAGGEGLGPRALRPAPKWYSDTVTAIMVPPGINGAEVIDVAYRRYNLALGAGLARMAGRLFRIGHLGDLNELHAAGRAGRVRDGYARRWHEDHSGQRRRPRRRNTGGARASPPIQAGASAPRARCAARLAGPRRRSRPAPAR